MGGGARGGQRGRWYVMGWRVETVCACCPALRPPRPHPLAPPHAAVSCTTLGRATRSAAPPAPSGMAWSLFGMRCACCGLATCPMVSVAARRGSAARRWVSEADRAPPQTTPPLPVPPAVYLRGYNVADVFERHVRAFAKPTRRCAPRAPLPLCARPACRPQCGLPCHVFSCPPPPTPHPSSKLQYYRKLLPPGGLPHGIPLYGVYSPTPHDDDFAFYTALLHRCEGVEGEATDCDASSAGSSEGRVPALQHGGAAAAARCAASAHAAVRALDPGRVAALLHEADAVQGAEALLGMRVFLGGASPGAYLEWRTAAGLDPPSGGER